MCKTYHRLYSNSVGKTRSSSEIESNVEPPAVRSTSDVQLAGLNMLQPIVTLIINGSGYIANTMGGGGDVCVRRKWCLSISSACTECIESPIHLQSMKKAAPVISCCIV